MYTCIAMMLSFWTVYMNQHRVNCDNKKVWNLQPNKVCSDCVTINRFRDKLHRTWFTIRALVMMVPITGVNWLFGLLSLVSSNQLVYGWLFSITNALQGFSLLVFHCLLQSDVRQRYTMWRSRSQIDLCKTVPDRPSQITILSFESTEQRPKSVPVRRSGVQLVRPSSA